MRLGFLFLILLSTIAACDIDDVPTLMNLDYEKH